MPVRFMSDFTPSTLSLYKVTLYKVENSLGIFDLLIPIKQMQVLGLAGFGQEESRSIFAQVDTDGGGSVELDEFEAWWIESQRQQVGGIEGRDDLSTMMNVMY